MDKRALKGVNKASKELKKEKELKKIDIKTNLTKLEDLKGNSNWQEETKIFFEIVKSELILNQTLFKIDTMQLLSAFEIFNEAQKIKKEKMNNIDDKDYLPYLKSYTRLIELCFSMLKDFYITPAQRLKLAQQIVEIKNSENSNKAVIKLLGD